METKRIFKLLLLLLLLTACGKNKEVKIIAKNAATDGRFAGLRYVVVSSRTAANGEKHKTEASGTLNSNGEAMVSIKKKSGRSYSIQVKAPENSCYTNQSPQFFDSPYDVNGTFTFEFAGCAYLTLSVNNVNFQGATDKIVYDLQPIYIPNYSNIIPTEKLGCYSNTFIESIIPYGNWEATWKVTRGGITTQHNSLFFINENEHFNFPIDY